MVGFTGPVDCWFHWSIEFTRFTGLSFDDTFEQKEIATCSPATAGKNSGDSPFADGREVALN